MEIGHCVHRTFGYIAWLVHARYAANLLVKWARPDVGHRDHRKSVDVAGDPCLAVLAIILSG